jgi:hypothetical protein
MMIFAHGAIISAVIPRTEHVSPERSYAAVVAGKVRNPRIERTVEQEKADSRREGGRWTLVNASKKERRPHHSNMMMINARGAIGEAIPRTRPPVQKERVLALESKKKNNDEHVSQSSGPLAKIEGKGDDADASISTFESPLKEYAEFNAVEDEKLEAIVEETGGVAKKPRLELEEKTQELAPPQQERTVFQNSLDTAQMEVGLLEDAIARASEQLTRTKGELNSLYGMQGAKRKELLECESELVRSKVRTELELGELGQRKTTLAERSAELLVSSSE